MTGRKTTRVLVVCLGNICRSAMAEGILRARLALRDDAMIVVDSAGTGDWHAGAPPDPRAVDAAATRGIDIATLRARQITPEDFEHFDRIVAMDDANVATLTRLAPPVHAHKIVKMLSFARGCQNPAPDIPDPYYGDAGGFDHVLDLLEDAADGLIEDLVGS